MIETTVFCTFSSEMFSTYSVLFLSYFGTVQIPIPHFTSTWTRYDSVQVDSVSTVKVLNYSSPKYKLGKRQFTVTWHFTGSYPRALETYEMLQANPGLQFHSDGRWEKPFFTFRIKIHPKCKSDCLEERLSLSAGPTGVSFFFFNSLVVFKRCY